MVLLDAIAVVTAVLTATVTGCAFWASGRGAWHLLAAFGCTMAALVSASPEVAWAAMAVATMASIYAMARPRTPAALAAAWRLFLLSGAALLPALLGVVALAAPSSHADGPLLTLGFVLVLAGYGAQVTLAPLHAWTGGDHPSPLPAVVARSLANVALLQILRLRGVLAGNADAVGPDGPILALGLACVLAAGLAMPRQRDPNKFLALASLWLSGTVATAFGLGPTATYAGLFHLTVGTAALAALCCAPATTRHRLARSTVAGAFLALACLPPSGLFASLFLLLSAAVRASPLGAALLGVGVLAGILALLGRVPALAPGPGTGPATGPAWSVALAPAWLLLGLVVFAGTLMPAPLAAWLQAVAATLP